MTDSFKRTVVHGAQEAYRVFFEVIKHDDADAVVKAASEFFGLPVLLTDENYKLVCQYPKRRIGQIIWDTLYEEQVLPLETIQAYQQTYLSDEKHYYDPFYSNEELASDCPRIFGEVHSQARIYGHVAIFMFDNPLMPEDLAAARIFIDALQLLMLPRKRRETASLTSYMCDLLDENTAPQVRSLAIRCLSEYISGPFSVMVTPIGDTAAQRAFAAMVISQMPDTYQSVVNAIHNDCIVTLFGLMKGGQHSEKEISFFHRVAEYLSPSKTSSGISQPFSDLSELSGRYQQAYMTALVTEAPCGFFDFVFPAPIFKAVSRNVQAEMFMHPALKQMLEYDKENQTLRSKQNP